MYKRQAIYYDSSEYNLLKQSTFWLSSNPLEVSVGWDAALERICTYGYFEHKNSDKRIWVFNTHFDHIGRISREESSKLILDQINKLNGFSEPTVVMGDFNDYPYNESVSKLTDDKKMPMKPQRVLHDLRSVMRSSDVLISDVGAHKMWVAREYNCTKPNTCLISNGFCTMGFALPGSMGAKIKGIGSNLLVIEGVDSLAGANHSVLPDMIEIGSWIGLAAMTKSNIRIKDVSWDNLGVIPNVFRSLGITLIKEGDDIVIPEHKNGYEISNYIDGSILSISDAPWPGFSPDLLSIILVIATQARGSVLIHQKMFESRLFFVDKLIDMGAKIILCDPHRATVIGHDFKSSLKATTMSSPDIRAGISLLIAALSAKGESVIQNIEQIDRGYENIDERLRLLGASIERI